MDEINQPNRNQPKRQYQRPKVDLVRADYTKGAYEAQTDNTNTPEKPKKRHKRPVSFIRKEYGQIKAFIFRHQVGSRIGFGLLACLMLFVVLNEATSWRNKDISYHLSDKSKTLVGEPVAQYAEKLMYDSKENKFNYNKDYTPSTGEIAGQISGPKFSAVFNGDPQKGIDVTDPVKKTTVTFKPKFKMDEPRKDENRLIYPLFGKNGAKVITMKAGNIKEDIVIDEFSGDKLQFDYDIELPDELEARLENDGSIGIYGPDEGALFGSVSTGNEKDAELLKKAREKATKNDLVFRVPAPFIKEFGDKRSEAHTWYGLKDNTLSVYTEGLKSANYPISIDPSVYIETAAKLMQGNNETNLDFDVDNELIQKGKTTGARIDSWSSTLALPSARWNHSTAVYGGYIYVVGGNSGSAQVADMYWAKFDTTNYDIDSTNPGAGTCSNWCTNSAYNLPAVRDGASLVAYNGFLYLFGGRNGSDVRQSTVYITKLGANGEPSLWHPTDTNKNNWVYWYTDTALSTERAFSSAAAYNNRIYLAGGQTTAATGGVTTMQYADVKPTGALGSWTSTGMVALPSARHNHTIQIYNDRMYLIGGNSSGALQAGVSYIKLTSDGTMTGSWASTTSFTTARMAWGGSMSTIWGGYLYIAGGCTAINGSGYCTTIASDIQLASINADGTITDWGTITGVTSARMGYGLTAWRNTLYGIGGCTAHNTSTGVCTTTATLTQYGRIKTDGEASTVSNSVPSGTSPCVTTAWIDCDMPPLGNGNGESGQLAGGTIINNGFIYYIGGCQAVGNNSVCFTGAASKTSDTISYSAINVDGTLTRSSSCVGTYYGSWCVDNTNTINGSTGVAAFAHTIFNNVIYAIGGTTGTDWQTTVWRNPLNADGSLGSWSTQTFTNLDLGAYKGYQYAFTRANPSSAGTYPGNLYVIGGCGGALSADNGLDCTGTTYTGVYKCNIKTDGSLEETDANDCTTSGQLQMDSEPGTGGSQGLGVMAGTVYANYIYLIGGQSPNETERGSVMYAKIDNNNNIVDADGETAIDDIWTTSGNSLSPVRRRGVAFGYNGYLYALAGYNTGGGGSLNDLLFAKIDVSDGSIGAFTTSAVTVNARWDLRAIVNNGYVYTMGGCSVGTPPANCTSTTATIQTFQLYNNYSGSPYSYGAGANLFTTDRIGASSAVYNGNIYLAGGCTSATDCTTATDSVQYASISSTGALGTWAAHNNMPAARAWGQLEQAGGTLYWIGGQDSGGDEKSDVYYMAANASVGSSGGTIQHFSARRVAEQTKTTSGWSAITGTADSGTTASTNGWIDSTNLTTGDDYLILAWGSHGGSSTAQRTGIRVSHGGTSFTESEGVDENDTATYTSWKGSYAWFTVWTAASGEDLEAESYAESTSTSAVQDVTLVAIRAEDLVASGDLKYDIQTGGGALDTTPTAKASITWTPTNNNDSWWLSGYTRFDTQTDGAAADQQSRLNIDSGKIRSSSVTEGENTDPNPIRPIGWVEPLTAESHTVALEVSEAAATHDWLAAGVFALRLNRFESFAEYSVAGDATNVLSTLNTWAEIGNIDPTVVTQGDWLVAAGTMADDNDGRVQTRIESSDSTIAGGDGTGGWQHDTSDRMPNAHADMQINWTVGSKNIDVDGRNTVAATSEAEDVWAVGFSMKEAGWATATNGLPADRTKMGATVWNNRIYVVGGLDDSAAVTSTVYVSPSLSAGGNITSAWASSTAFNVAREGATAVAYANNLYLLGGDDKTNYLNDVQYTQINSDGTVDSWSYSASLPGKVSGAEGFAANGFMYLIGGRSASATCDSSTLVAPISANTTIASGNNPTGVGEWYETNVKYTGSRYGNAVSYYEGKAYVLGGGCGATLTYTGTNRVVQTTMQSQPQVAKYSRRIDTDTDVFPTKWLMNGLDNSTGAQWYMKYRTMNDTDGAATDCGSADMSTWGRETNYGIVTLGTPADYNPLDGSGTDIDCARHYYMSVTIDSTYAFGYPEDVSRGPTIADLSLFFTSDPSKRLRHGKTFTGGQQQPLDTPF